LEGTKKSKKIRQKITVYKVGMRGGLEGFQTAIHPGGYMAAIY